VLLESALRNSLAWYGAVLGAHGIESELTENYWATDAAVPPYYSNLVTTTGAEGTPSQLARIRALAAAPPKPDWSLKDSFARLELEPLGLRVLFDAQWFGLPAGALDNPDRETDLRFVPVADAAALKHWERAWQQSSPAPGRRVFPPGLLSHPDVTFLSVMRGSQLVGGAAANLSSGAVGLSNVFGPSLALQRDCVRFLRALHPDRAIVGYGRAAGLRDLAPLGSLELGSLRVWVAALD